MCSELYRCRNRVLSSKSRMFTKETSSRQVVADSGFLTEHPAQPSVSYWRVVPLKSSEQILKFKWAWKLQGRFLTVWRDFLSEEKESRTKSPASWRHEILPPSIRQVVREMGRKCTWQNRWLVLIGIKSFRSTFCSGNNPSFPFTQPQDESVFLLSVVLIGSCGLSF